MTAVLTHSSYIETFQFSAGQRTVRVSVMSSFPVADCSTLTDQRLKSFVDRSQLFLSVRGTTRSPYIQVLPKFPRLLSSAT